jgi:hypothetical protein
LMPRPISRRIGGQFKFTQSSALDNLDKNLL